MWHLDLEQLTVFVCKVHIGIGLSTRWRTSPLFTSNRLSISRAMPSRLFLDFIASENFTKCKGRPVLFFEESGTVPIESPD